MNATEKEQERDTLPFSALRDEGLLWLINRVVFHPRGFALALDYDEHISDEPQGWRLLGDGSEVWTMDTDEDELFRKAEGFMDRHRATR